ncbi:ROK family protein [Nonomuraea basaltis]|uniref:ROK family protein n=1 Tax=Nonomuraea basaltis TaxID=2495887 RepID=UPI00110C6BA4|nr:ROK family protein [Nonomuraea basaltis]TMS00607.1 ROK family protein [Nonomuraea basaltis]
MRRVLGIDVGGTKIAVGLSGADGPEIATRVRLETGENPLARALQAARGLDRAPAAVGFSTCGVISGGRVLLAPNVPGWNGLELPRLLREEYGKIPVAIGNDVKAAAVAELRWGALRGVSTGLYLNLGTGLAAALVVGGQVVDGAHGAAGEIGYLLAEPGEPSFADGHAPLEERFSGGALVAHGSTLLGRTVPAGALFGLPETAVLVDEALRTLAMAVANLCVALDPERVVVGGGMMAEGARILPPLTREVRRVVPFPPELRAARFTDDAPLLGALALAHALI